MVFQISQYQVDLGPRGADRKDCIGRRLVLDPAMEDQVKTGSPEPQGNCQAQPFGAAGYQNRETWGRGHGSRVIGGGELPRPPPRVLR